MQTTILKIDGMTCMGCVNSIKTILEKIPGVLHVEVSLEKTQATIQYDAVVSNNNLFIASIEDAGFDVVG